MLPLLLLGVGLPRALADGGFSWPVDGQVNRGFEKPTGPYGEGGHQGVDIAAPPGGTVRSAGAGTVCWVGELPRGRFVSITHDGGRRTTYLDLADIGVTVGQKVARGQPIGTVGGTRDPSSPGSHLHFDAYINGSPVDPRLLFGGLDAGSYIRLCPAGGQTSPSPSANAEPAGDSFWHTVTSPVAGACEFIGSAFSGAWDGLCALGRWTAGGFDKLWDKVLYPALRSTGHAIATGAEWCWNNRYFKAAVAGVAAACVVIAAIVVVVLTLPVSILCGVVAAIAATIACIGISIYYAATHPAGFSFLECFLKCASAGLATAATVLSMGSLGAAFSAGWAEIGLTGVLKCSLTNGLFSAIFEGSFSYLFTGHISLRRMLVAFTISAISGPVVKALKEGFVGSRLVQALIVSVQEGHVSLSAQTAVLFLKQSGQALHGILTLLADGATAFGGKLVYLTFSGAFGVLTNITSCMLNGKPVTFSSMLASFMTGVLMGAIGLTFKGLGMEGLLARFEMFKKGFGRIARRALVKLVTKSMHKGISKGLTSGFKRLFGENTPSTVKEE